FEIKYKIENLILSRKNTIKKAISGSTYAQARKQLNNHSFLYIEQLTSLDGSYLLNWRDISRRYNARVFKTPKWFIELSSVVLENSSMRLVKSQYRVKTNVIKGNFFQLLPFTESKGKEWILLWNFHTVTPIIANIKKKFHNVN